MQVRDVLTQIRVMAGLIESSLDGMTGAAADRCKGMLSALKQGLATTTAESILDVASRNPRAGHEQLRALAGLANAVPQELQKLLFESTTQVRATMNKSMAVSG